MKANQSLPNEQITNRNSHGIKRRGIKTSDLQSHIHAFLYYFTRVVTAILPLAKTSQVTQYHKWTRHV